MKFSVVIPSRWNISKLQGIVKSISLQSNLPDKVFIVIDKFLSKDEFDVLKYFISKWLSDKFVSSLVFVSNLNYNFLPNNWVSYVRNFWIKLVETDYLYVIDDDNIFNSDFFEKSISLYLELSEKLNSDLIFSPTIIYRKTWIIQSQGISRINPFLWKVVLNYINNWKDYSVVKMIWWNSLFSKTKNFLEHRFDEYFSFVYEDLDFSWWCSNAWLTVIVSSLVEIYHMERNKTKAEKSFIWNPDMAYQKSRNRIMLVRKNWSKFFKYIFIFSWLWIQTLWFFFLVLFFWWKNKYSTIKSIIKWTFDWIKY